MTAPVLAGWVADCLVLRGVCAEVEGGPPLCCGGDCGGSCWCVGADSSLETARQPTKHKLTTILEIESGGHMTSLICNF